MLKRMVIMLGFLLLSQSVLAETSVALKPDHPGYYVVKPNDTIWKVASKFLVKPWQWSRIWAVNDHEGKNEPIYPGDVLKLTFVHDKPQLILSQAATVKLSPNVRSTPIKSAIPVLPTSVIRPFLNASMVIDSPAFFKELPFIVSQAGEHLVTGAGDKIFVKGLPEKSKTIDYALFRLGGAYIKPGTKEVLGYHGIYIGEARLVKSSHPALMELTKTSREVMVGDVLCPKEDAEFDQTIYPHAPKNRVRGQIISVMGGISQIAQYSVVALDLGQKDGMNVGDVLRIIAKGSLVKNPKSTINNPLPAVQLPDEPEGMLMVFRVFNRVSYGLVLKSNQAIAVNDYVTNP